MFKRNIKNKTLSNKPIGNLKAVMPAHKLLNTNKRQLLLREIKHFSHFNQEQFENLCTPLINKVASYCQQLSDFSCRYYNEKGGLLDSILHRTHAALELMHESLVLKETKICSNEQMIWIYTLFSASMLQGLGKLYTDYKIDIFNPLGIVLKTWDPLVDGEFPLDTYYDDQSIKEQNIELRRRVNILLARQLIPDQGFELIACNPSIFSIWLALLNEDDYEAGMLGAILSRAKIIAAQRYVEYFIQAEAPNSHNTTNYFVDNVNNPRQTETDFLLGAKFLQWLTYALENGQIQLNRSPGCILMPDGLFLSVELFKQFIKENNQYKNWRAVQKSVEAWKLSNIKNYKKEASGIMIDLSVIPKTVHIYNPTAPEIRLGLKIESLLHSNEPVFTQTLSVQGKWINNKSTQLPNILTQERPQHV